MEATMTKTLRIASIITILVALLAWGLLRSYNAALEAPAVAGVQE